jgi:hypothetical protein
MIKIDTVKFNSDKITGIYKSKAFNKKIKKTISNIVDKPNTTSSITIRLLKDWFYIGENISEAKTFEFLTSKNIAVYIQDYYRELRCEMHSMDYQYFELKEKLLTLKRVVKKENNLYKRKEAMQSLITKENVHLLNGITVEDLSKEPKKGSVYSNLAKISRIVMDPELSKYDAIRLKANEEFEKIFDYKHFVNSYRHQIISSFNIEVCPYCNRQYINNMVLKEKHLTTADLDHYFCKSKYPFLALSLYNFVPSCTLCNSRFKRDQDFWFTKHIYPFESGFDRDACFHFEGIDHLVGKDPVYKLDNKMSSMPIQNSIETFRLNELYESHIEYVKELLLKVKINDESQIKEYLENYPDLFQNREELLRLIFGNYLTPENFNKKPLAKLTRDLITDMGVKIE